MKFEKAAIKTQLCLEFVIKTTTQLLHTKRSQGRQLARRIFFCFGHWQMISGCLVVLVISHMELVSAHYIHQKRKERMKEGYPQ